LSLSFGGAGGYRGSTTRLAHASKAIFSGSICKKYTRFSRLYSRIYRHYGIINRH